MFNKIFWALFMIGNLLGAFYFVASGNNIVLALIHLCLAYLCWKELKDV